MMVLMIPVIPHHHHANGLVCMKNDITADCCGHHHTSTNDHHCCNTTGCMMAHFVQQVPQPDDIGSHLNKLQATILFITPFTDLPSLSESEMKRQKHLYLETLHDTLITRVTGLRAPPSVLA